MKKFLLIPLILFLYSISCFAQAPNITYAGPQVYTSGTAITTLSPTNTGGTVPPNVYQQVSTLAGSGTIGFVNATGTSAKFNEPYSVACDASGNVYVADRSSNVIRKITSAGVVTTFAGSGTAGALDGTGTAATFNNPAGVATDATGNVYVADSYNNTIRKITPAGVVTTYAGTGLQGNADGAATTVASFAVPLAVAVDATGNVYVGDENNVIRKITPGGVVSTFATGFSDPVGIACDAAGNLYVADRSNVVIKKVTAAGVVSIFAGSGATGSADGTGTAATFNFPTGVAVDAAGNVYIGDAGNSAIRKITSARIVTTFAGGNNGFVNGIGTAATFATPTGLTTDSQGTLYVADDGNYAIRKIGTSGYTISPALPTGLSFDSTTGKISGTPTGASASANYTITAYNISGSSSTTLNITVNGGNANLSALTLSSGSFSPAFSGATTSYSSSVANTVASVTVTPTVSDATATVKVNGTTVASGSASGAITLYSGTNSISIVVTAHDGITTQTYTIAIIKALPTAPNISYTSPQIYTVGTAISSLTPANSGGAVPANNYLQASQLAGSAYNSYGICADAQGNLYVSDGTNNIIKKITATGVVSTLAGSGAAGAADGTGTAATFSVPLGLAVDGQGNIYVADSQNNLIRKITSAGVVTTFAGNGAYGATNGAGTLATFANPSGVAVDAYGNVYVADANNNLVRKITPAGVVSTLASGFNVPSGITCDAAGNIYVADNGNFLIRKITAAGVVSTLAGNGLNGYTDATGTAASFSSVFALSADLQGNIIVADAGNGVIRKITSAGVVTTIAVTAVSFSYPTGLATDNQGNIYTSDVGNDRIYKIPTTGYTISATLPPGLSFDNTTGIISGTPTATSAATDYIITAYNTGGNSTTTVNIKVVAGNANLSALTLNTATLSPTFSSATTSYTASVTNGTTSVTVTPTLSDATATLKVNGNALASGSTSAAISLNPGVNTIYITVTAHDGITLQTYTIDVTRALPSAPVISYTTPQIYTTGTAISPLSPANSGGAVPANSYALVSTVAGSGTAGYLNGTGTAAKFYQPPAIASDATGTLYVADQNRIRMITSAGVVTTLAGGSLPGSTNGTGTSASFDTPSGLATDGIGNVYVADAANNLIRKITPVGVVTTFAGDGTYTAVNGAALTASFANPNGVAIDPFGNIYVADTDNNLIRKITTDGTVSTFAGSGAAGKVNGTGAAASFNAPTGVACDAAGNVYVADQGNSMIRKITTAGVVTTLAGSGIAGAANGTGTAASFGTRIGITVDQIGNVFVADADNNEIRKITSVGVVTTYAGNGGFNATNGIGTVAGFGYETGVAADSQGNIYVADLGNNIIRKISTTGYASISPALPAGLSFDTTTGIVSGTPTATSAATTYTVTAYNVSGSSTTTVNITVVSTATDATLTALTSTAGTLSPTFAKLSTTYTVSVASGVTSTTVTPTITVAGATVKVNGVAVTSGSASSAIPLAVGSNSITIIVTAQNGTTTKTYTLNVTRATPPVSTIATLSALTLSSGTLSPTFASATTTYTVSVTNATSGITLTPTLTDATATVKVNGSTVPNGTASGAIPLSVGSNIITVTGTAQDGTTTQPYTVTVTRAQSSVATLSNLTTSSGTVSPTFASATTSYTVSVPNPTSSITLTPTLTDATATVKVNGNTVTNATASGVIPLSVGSNIITVTGTAQDGTTTQPYTVTVTRAQSSVATLSNLTISNGTLSPTFASATAGYTVGVSNATSSITLTPTLTDATATVKVNGTTVASGNASASIPLNVGSNVITIIGTAQDGTTTQTYTVTVTRAQSSIATLSSLTTSSGTLSPTFASATTAYTVSVTNAISSITLTPTLTDATATVKVNGSTVPNGTASASIPLSVGSNIITVTGTAQDGTTTQPYTVTVTRAQSSIATLSSLTTSSGTLSPTFASATTAYTVSVTNAISSITLTPTLTDATATVKVNGSTVTNGTASASIPLSVGSNIITVTGTAQDGTTTQPYTVTVTRAQSSIATLSSLTTSSGTLSPAFASATTAYTVSVTNATNSITLTPTLTDATATVKVNGSTVTNATASGAIPLSIGSNIITVTGTAQDGTTTQTYTVTVTRAQSSVATLSSLTASSGTLSPAFASATTAYTVSVTNATSSITLTPTLTDATATVKVNGSTVTNGTASASIPLNVGSNTINIIGTAQDGTTQPYTVTVTRAQSSIATLSSLTTSSGTLSPTFASATTTYTVSVTNATSGITLTPTLTDATATVKVNGSTVTNATASGAIPLSVGSNAITITGTAQDGTTTQTYTVTVTRAQSSVATLSSLTASSGTLSPAFASATTAYTVSVTNATSSITLTPTLTDATATVKVNGSTVTNGTASASIPLNVGSNTINIIGTAQDGTTQPYTVTVTRAQSSIATLSSLTTSSGTLSPTFTSATTAYTVSVTNATSSITLTPTLTDATATVKVNGSTVTSGTASASIPLSVGSNIITVTGTAQDGTTQPYTVTVTRAQSSIATLSNLTTSSGTLSPTFASATTAYAASVPNTTSSITLTPTLTDATATVKVNGSTVSNGTASGAIPLSVGNNPITVVVTAQDGATIISYSITVTRAASTLATLSSLSLSSGIISPVFASGTTTYSASVSNATTSVTTTPTTTDGTATVTVNGNPVISGAASSAINLNVGTNAVTVVVTAQDGITKQTYNLTVTRATPPNSVPIVVYTSPQSYVINNTISSLVPVNNGGIVPATVYGQVSTFAGSGAAGSTNSTGISSRFNGPSSAVVDGLGNIYIADNKNNLIRMITPAGVTSTFAGTGAAGSTNGPGIGASFKLPYGIAADAQGNIYVADTGNGLIRMITPAGVVSTLAGSGATGSANGTGTAASFNSPDGLTVDAQGNVYVADTGNGLIRMITPAGVVTTFAGSGAIGAANGTGTGASFNGPTSMAIDAQGNLYVADQYNQLIRKITPGGVVTTLAGSGANGSADGTGTAATFAYPTGITTDSQGNVYVADNNNNKIRNITPAGVVSTIAGNGSAGSTNGTGTAATFRGAAGLAADASGNLYVTDTDNNLIRKIILTGYTISPSLPAGLSFDATTGTISGTPTITSPATDYTVTAYNETGNSSTIVNIAVVLSPDATLSNLVPGSGTLSPVFASTTTGYTISVPNATSGITLTPTVNNANATIKVKGVSVTSGTASGNIALLVGSNTINTVVTAQDGINNKTYTVTVTRAPSADADLAAISLSTGALSPTFAANSLAYTASVANAISSITLTPTEADPTASITVNGTAVNSGAASGAIALTVGSNTITVAVTAQDGITIKTYTVTVTRAPSSNANLLAIGLSAGTLSPVFAPATISYTVNVGNAVSSVTLTPTAADATATITVNGTAVSSGIASAPIALTVGTTPIAVTVTAQNHTTIETYTVNVTRAPSSNADLSAISLSSGILSPVFAPSTINYGTSVGNAVSSITLTPTVTDATATITVNGTAVNSGSASASISLSVGTTPINTIVTAQDGSTKTYTVSVTRAPSAIATLAGITLSGGTLAPVFSSGTSSYTTSVSNATTSITLTPTLTDATATIKVNGNTVSSGTASAAIPLTVGNNTITTTVTAQDGTSTQTYTVTVNRAASAIATLANLTISSGTLTPTFATATLAYTASVVNTITSMTLTPTLTDATATIKVNGTVVSSGSASVAIPLAVGNNIITTAITAQDGTTVKTYTVTVNRAASAIATLNNLTLSSGTLSPVFASATNTYTASVANAISSITVTPTVTDATATIKVNGNTVSSASASAPIPLIVGNNTITTAVTAQDGTTIQTYTITVNRAPSAVATLANITLSTGTLSPVFASGIFTYTASVSNANSSITLTPTATDPTATIKVNGSVVSSGAASTPIPLIVGGNTITTISTAQDGSTIKTYTITITRAPSAIATLAGITLSSGTLAPVFASGTSSYTTSVSNATTSITLTSTLTDATATIKVNGNTVSSGIASAAIPLTVGNNTITTTVTAQDGTSTQTYTVTVNRAASAIATLANLTISSGTLTPTFATATLAYTASVVNTITSMTLTPTLTDATATIKVNGNTVSSGSASAVLPLIVGNNTITTVITAQDGTTTQTYTVTVNRAASAIATLNNLTLSSGTLSPVFASATNTYTASVANAISSITVTPTVTDATATIKVNGSTVSSGAASTAIPLIAGNNTITTAVTAQDGTTIQTYTITVNRAPSAVATLSNVAISAGTLSPVFATATNSYTATVGNAVTTITITPTATDVNAIVKVNGNVVSSGSTSAAIPLIVGTNTITTLVTAQDGITTKTYAVVVTRLPSSNDNLASLSLSSGTLSPIFASAITSYTASLNNAISVITLTPVTSDATATVKVNGVVVTSGSSSGAVPLSVGSNVITTTVTAQDGTTIKTYTLTVTRAAPSANADLTALTLSAGTISPVFVPGITNYGVSVGNTVTSTTITPVTSDAFATIKVNGFTVNSNSASPVIALTVGNNTINTVVTAQDGTTIKTYTVNINRAASANADLLALGLSTGTLTPAFGTATLGYTASVGNATTSIAITPVSSDATATIKVNGNLVTNGSTSAAAPLNVGSNIISTTVTAQDGVTVKTYTLTVTRAPSANADLSALTTNAGVLTPGFSTGTLTYTQAVSNATNTITVTPTTSDATATIKVNGNTVGSGATSNALPLVVGTNSITTTITAQDGITIKTYTIAVTRAPSSNADLSALSLSNGTLSPVFAPATTGYTVSVVNAANTITVTPTTSDANSNVKVNGATVSSGSASGPVNLIVGDNTIIVSVTAQDGTTVKNYNVVVTRAPSSNANLSALSLSAGILSPQFTSGSTNYTTNVNYTATTITVTPTTSDAAASVTVNGVSVNSGSPSAAIALNVGPNTITTVVKAQDGTTTQTYTVSINRDFPSANANLTALGVSVGSLSPIFNSALTTYHVSVGTSISSIKLTPVTSDVNANIKVNGITVSGGSASSAINLSIGANTITTTVTAQDGSTVKNYIVVVNRAAPSSNADLIDLSLSTGVLSPSFITANTGYTAVISNLVPAITLIPVTSDANATVKVNGATVISGSPSLPVLLTVGANIITVTVTAQDGATTKNYTVTITRAPQLITPPNMFTPNGDGINDTWNIPFLSAYPDCTVRIFNRAGKLLYSSIGYSVQWDGRANGADLPTGTYYYIIDPKHGLDVVSGAITIFR